VTDAGVLGRARVVVEPAERRVELRVDGWPVVLVELEAGVVRVNDLGATAAFAHAAPLPGGGGGQVIRTGAVGDELYLLVGDVAAVFVVLAPTRPAHADVQVMESATGQLLLDREVRYRQVGPKVVTASSAGAEAPG
jgi:hypothetical protein